MEDMNRLKKNGAFHLVLKKNPYQTYKINALFHDSKNDDPRFRRFAPAPPRSCYFSSPERYAHHVAPSMPGFRTRHVRMNFQTAFTHTLCGKNMWKNAYKKANTSSFFSWKSVSNIATHSNSTCSPGSRCPWHVVGLRAKGLELIEASKSCETPSSNVQVSVWKNSWAIEMQKKLMNHWKKIKILSWHHFCVQRWQWRSKTTVTSLRVNRSTVAFSWTRNFQNLRLDRQQHWQNVYTCCVYCIGIFHNLRWWPVTCCWST